MAKQTPDLAALRHKRWKPPEIQREDLVERVSRQLREEIIRETFRAGETLPSEMELAEAFGVSRRVIRESLRILKSEGLVEINQGKRPSVRPANDEAVRNSLDTNLRRLDCRLVEIYEARRPIEIEIAGLAAQRATPQDIEQIELHHQAYDQSTQSGTILQFNKRIETDIAFHLAIASAAHNPVLELLYRNLFTLLWQQCMADEHFMRGMIDKNIKTRRYLPIQFHNRMLEAIRAHDADAARKAATEHLDKSLLVIHLQETDA